MSKLSFQGNHFQLWDIHPPQKSQNHSSPKMRLIFQMLSILASVHVAIGCGCLARPLWCSWRHPASGYPTWTRWSWPKSQIPCNISQFPQVFFFLGGMGVPTWFMGYLDLQNGSFFEVQIWCYMYYFFKRFIPIAKGWLILHHFLSTLWVKLAVSPNKTFSGVEAFIPLVIRLELVRWYDSPRET